MRPIFVIAAAALVHAQAQTMLTASSWAPHRQGIRNGESRACYLARIVALGLYGMMNWTYHWLRLGGALSPREIGELFAGIAMNGLLQQGSRAGGQP